jgi:hypothetical protein
MLALTQNKVRFLEEYILFITLFVSGGAAMILHGFCNNENTPFKEAVLIFTLKL